MQNDPSLYQDYQGLYFGLTCSQKHTLLHHVFWDAPTCARVLSSLYYMASSVSGQDEPNRTPNFIKSHIINPLLTKFVRSRWLDIGLVLFFASLWTSTSSRSINTQRKRTWPVSSHLDRTNLVNNPYIYITGRTELTW